MIKYVFTDLPKLSLNEWYSSKHWTKRQAAKTTYHLLLKTRVQQIDYPCTTAYFFEFKTHALDQTNCVAMVKMIEDCIFPNDGPKIVKDLYVKSFKSPRRKELDEKKVDMVVTVMIKPYDGE